MTAFDFAAHAQNSALYAILSPAYKFDVPEQVMAKITSSFHGLICHDMGWSNTVPLPDLDVLKEGNGDGWFPVRRGVTSEVQFSPKSFFRQYTGV